MVFSGMLAFPVSVFGSAYGEDYDMVYLLACLYAVLFGLGVLLIEVKEQRVATRAAWQWVIVYLKFLTLQRGKGFFYLGVGILVFVISPIDRGALFDIGIVNIAGAILAGVSLLHMCAHSPCCTCAPLHAAHVRARCSPATLPQLPPPRSLLLPHRPSSYLSQEPPPSLPRASALSLSQ